MPSIEKREQKKSIAKEIVKKIEQSYLTLFYDFSEIDNENFFFLRKKIKKKTKIEPTVYKNTLIEKAISPFKVNDFDFEKKKIKGNNFLIFCVEEDENYLSIIKDLYSFSENKKNNEKRLKLAIQFDSKIKKKSLINSDELEKWAKLPERQNLIFFLCCVIGQNLKRLTKILEEIKF